MTAAKPISRTLPIAKSRNSPSLLIVLFFLSTFAVPLFWLIRGDDQQDKTLLESRKLEKFEFAGLGFKTAFFDLIKGNPDTGQDLFKELLLKRSLFIKYEKAASDQFPLRLPAINAAGSIDCLAIQLTYLPLPDAAIPTDMHANIYIIPDTQFLFYGPDKLDPWTLYTTQLRINNYADLLSAHPQLNFYVYTIERLQNLPFHPLAAAFPSAESGQYFSTFKQNKPADLLLGTLEMTSFADYSCYFYRTDHHLNNLGAYNAYLDIHRLLSVNNPDISAPREITSEVTFPDIHFLGSLARTSKYPAQGEKFTIYTFSLPPFQTYKDGHEFTYGKQQAYLSGSYSLEPWLNHYAEYYGYDEGFLEFVFEGQPDRSLLVVGDSYDNAFLTLLASHYHHTYSVDLRNYPEFSLSTFLQAHPVQDVLVVGSNVAAYTSIDWTIQP